MEHVALGKVPWPFNQTSWFWHSKPNYFTRRIIFHCHEIPCNFSNEENQSRFENIWKMKAQLRIQSSLGLESSSVSPKNLYYCHLLQDLLYINFLAIHPDSEWQTFSTTHSNPFSYAPYCCKTNRPYHYCHPRLYPFNDNMSSSNKQ